MVPSLPATFSLRNPYYYRFASRSTSDSLPLVNKHLAQQKVFQRSRAGRAVAHKAYTRNMALMKTWKETHPCAVCGKKFPHYMMAFDLPTEREEWSVAVLAASRCSVEVLEEAMKKTPLLCANHRAEREYQTNKVLQME